MDVKSWPIRKQILFWIGITVIQATIFFIALTIISYFTQKEQTFTQWILLGIFCFLGAMPLTLWQSGIFEKKK